MEINLLAGERLDHIFVALLFIFIIFFLQARPQDLEQQTDRSLQILPTYKMA